MRKGGKKGSFMLVQAKELCFFAICAEPVNSDNFPMYSSTIFIVEKESWKNCIIRTSAHQL